eukprot:m.18745 g.18745  ORF g.18745 m.18745 type:complete len:91 (-) comp7940_c0_seq1:251-523(-)
MVDQGAPEVTDRQPALQLIWCEAWQTHAQTQHTQLFATRVNMSAQSKMPAIASYLNSCGTDLLRNKCLVFIRKIAQLCRSVEVLQLCFAY